MIDYQQFESNLQKVRKAIEDACRSCGRDPLEVQLLPVTKTHPVDAIRFCAKAMIGAVGENRVQEVSEKQAQDPRLEIKWELIGHLQSNKAKEAVELFDRIQSVDSIKLLRKLDRICEEAGKERAILLQFNSGEDPAKFGFSLEDAKTVLDAAMDCRNLNIEGLMTIAPLSEDRDVAVRAFTALRILRDDLEDSYSISLPELSMGMSQDLEPAIQAGSTQVRVGSALFGAR